LTKFHQDQLWGISKQTVKAGNLNLTESHNGKFILRAFHFFSAELVSDVRFLLKVGQKVTVLLTRNVFKT